MSRSLRIKHYTPENDVKRCWICFGTSDEPPPLTSRNGHDWVNPCQCSLVAHRVCLLEWINDIETRNSSLPNIDDDNNINITQSNLQRFVEQKGDSSTIIYGGIKCPQCKSPIYITISSSKILNFRRKMESTMKDGIKLSAIITAFGGTVSLSYWTFCIIGINIINKMCPEEMAHRILGVTESLRVSNSSTASQLSSDRKVAQLDGKTIGLLPAIPFYMMLLRKGIAFSPNELCLATIPLLLYEKLSDIHPKMIWKIGGVKLACTLVPFLRICYNLWYEGVINYLYYRLSVQIRPHLKDDMECLNSLDVDRNGIHVILNQEINDNGHEENRTQEHNANDIHHRPEANEQRLGNTLFSKIWSMFSDSFKWMIRQEKMLQWDFIPKTGYYSRLFHRDYSEIFQRKNILLQWITTLIWPYVGSFVGSFLVSKLKLPSFLQNSRFFQLFKRRLFYIHDKNYKFVGNIIGCCVVVMIKDLFNLYSAYKKVNQIKQRKILQYGSKEWKIINELGRKSNTRTIPSQRPVIQENRRNFQVGYMNVHVDF